jgi:hypothetical protein
MAHNPFYKLADEIILEILNHLNDQLHVDIEHISVDSLNPTLLAVAQTNRRLRRIALPLLYRCADCSRLALASLL